MFKNYCIHGSEKYLEGKKKVRFFYFSNFVNPLIHVLLAMSI